MPTIKHPEEQKGEQPEALREFEAAARAGGVKPSDQEMTAKPDTAPLPDSLEREQKTADEILKAGVAHDPKAMTEAARKSKDPRLP